MQESFGMKELYTQFHEHKLSHAFLLETNNQEACLKNLLNFLSKINETGNEEEDKKLRHLICTLQLPSLIVLSPDGQNIRKEQILELKHSFQTMPTFSTYNMYILLNAESLNASSANTMLKFLEEPEENILGFFLTNNKENMIDTIKSRCQIVLDYYNDCSSTLPKEWRDLSVQYVKEYETSLEGALFYNKNVLLPTLQEKKDLDFLLQGVFQIYSHFFLFFTCGKELLEDYLPLEFLKKKGKDYFLKQILYIAGLFDEINYNVNIQLFLDRFVLESR